MAKKTAARPAAKPGALRFKGKTFALAGTFYRWTKERITNLIQAEGGKLVTNIDDQLNYLVVRRGGTAQQDKKKAQQLNKSKTASIQIVTETDLYTLFYPDKDLALALLTGGPKALKRWNTIRTYHQRNTLDLTGADLHQARLKEANLSAVTLNQADLRKADLSRATLERLTGTQLDGACLAGARYPELIDCSLKKANLTGLQLRHRASLERSDFTGANLKGISASGCNATGAVFRKADLTQASLGAGILAGVDFSGADLKKAKLEQADLTGANLQRASLRQADLAGAKLPRADLTGADLRETVLLDADLSDAVIDGANFTGANLAGANLTGLDPARAKGLDPARTTSAGKIGPNLRELEQAGKAGNRLFTSASLRLPDGTKVNLWLQYNRNGRYLHAWSRSDTGNYRSTAQTLQAAMVDLPRRWPEGDLDQNSVEVKGSKTTVTGKALQRLALAAWCEGLRRGHPHGGGDQGEREGRQDQQEGPA